MTSNKDTSGDVASLGLRMIIVPAGPRREPRVLLGQSSNKAKAA